MAAESKTQLDYEQRTIDDLAVITTLFENCVFVIATTSGKFGTLVRVTVEERKVETSFEDEEETEEQRRESCLYNVAYLLGDRDDELAGLIGRQLMERIRSKPQGKLKGLRELLVGLGLKKSLSKETDSMKLVETAKSVIEAIVKDSRLL